MEKIFNFILIISILVAIYYALQKYKKENIENFEFTHPYMTKNIPVDTNKIQFIYDIREIDKKFLKEQEKGVHMMPYNMNNVIDRIDENGEPVYNTNNSNDMVDSKVRFSYDFNEPLINNMGGVVKQEDMGKTIKEIYDNSFVDFKKLTPKKNIISSEANSKSTNAASDLKFINPDVWTYDEEKPENGGVIAEGLFASEHKFEDNYAIF